MFQGITNSPRIQICGILFVTRCVTVSTCSRSAALTDTRVSKAVEHLKNGQIRFSSVELVCFTWLEAKDDQEDLEEEEDDDDDDDDDGDGETTNQGDLSLEYDKMPPVKFIEDRIRYTTPPTIWVGVLPDTLTSAVAHELATEILGIVNQYGVPGVDVAFRESVAHFSHDPGLFAPVDDDDHRKDAIDNLSTVLSLSIAGRKTSMQGTLTCFFRVGKELYAITARHNLFKDGKDDDEYIYVENCTFFLSPERTTAILTLHLPTYLRSRAQEGGYRHGT